MLGRNKIMDTSETYIKMCEKASEIQEFRISDSPIQHTFILRKGDWYVIKNDRVVIVSSTNKLALIDYCFWLPRQDQLQSILDSDIHAVASLNLFIAWLHGPVPPLGMTYHNVIELSMEQLWLMYVMKAKFGKFWNGEEWICQ